MSDVCQIRQRLTGKSREHGESKCGRTPGYGHNVSHSNRKTNRRFHLNLQRRKLQLPGDESVRDYKICTQCLRTMVKDQI